MKSTIHDLDKYARTWTFFFSFYLFIFLDDDEAYNIMS